MEFAWTEKHVQYRERINRLIAESLPEDWWESYAMEGPADPKLMQFARGFARKLAETGDVLEFADLDGFKDGFAAEFVFEDFFSVEPMFDVVALDENAGGIPFAGRFEGDIGGGREHVIKGGGAMFGA